MSDWFIGEIRLFAGYYAPEGWALCNGQLMNISESAQTEQLFGLFGTTYGGDGIRTFALPDLRGQLPIGTGTGPNLTPRPLGQKVGQETITITVAEMPQHQHSVSASTATATSKSPTAGIYADQPVSTTILGNYLPGARVLPNTKPAPMSASFISSAGAAVAHPNVMPTATLNYIIAVTGNWPPRPQLDEATGTEA